jgi:putative nucleotidyltransferase with HDIG domain
MVDMKIMLLEKLKAISQMDKDGDNEGLISFLAGAENIVGLHSIRVSGYAVMTAREMGLPEDLASILQVASLLHDIGKFMIPRDILYKTGRLSQEETALVQQHPLQGSGILNQIERYRQYADTVLYHHEFYNGLGYPHGLCGPDIPLLSRIIAVADSYEAMTSDRPYRKGFSHREAINRLKISRHLQFDPAVTDSFLRALKGFSGSIGTKNRTIHDL